MSKIDRMMNAGKAETKGQQKYGSNSLIYVLQE